MQVIENSKEIKYPKLMMDMDNKKVILVTGFYGDNIRGFVFEQGSFRSVQAYCRKDYSKLVKFDGRVLL